MFHVQSQRQASLTNKKDSLITNLRFTDLVLYYEMDNWMTVQKIITGCWHVILSAAISVYYYKLNHRKPILAATDKDDLGVTQCTPHSLSILILLPYPPGQTCKALILGAQT